MTKRIKAYDIRHVERDPNDTSIPFGLACGLFSDPEEHAGDTEPRRIVKVSGEKKPYFRRKPEGAPREYTERERGVIVQRERIVIEWLGEMLREDGCEVLAQQYYAGDLPGTLLYPGSDYKADLVVVIDGQTRWIEVNASHDLELEKLDFIQTVCDIKTPIIIYTITHPPVQLAIANLDESDLSPADKMRQLIARFGAGDWPNLQIVGELDTAVSYTAQQSLLDLSIDGIMQANRVEWTNGDITCVSRPSRGDPANRVLELYDDEINRSCRATLMRSRRFYFRLAINVEDRPTLWLDAPSNMDGRAVFKRMYEFLRGAA